MFLGRKISCCIGLVKFTIGRMDWDCSYSLILGLTPCSLVSQHGLNRHSFHRQ